MLRVAFLTLFSIALAAQNPQAPQGGQPKTPRLKIRPKAEQPGETKENKLIGRVGDTLYHESDLFDYLPLVMSAPDMERVRRIPDVQKQAKKRFMEQMLLVAAAQKEGLDKTPDFQTKLAGVTKTLLVQELIQKKGPDLNSRAAITEDSLKAFFEENIDKFKTKESASARHILVSVQANDSETDKLTDKEALARMAEVKEALLKGGSWDEVAKKYSDDPGSKERGGLYENFAPAQMVSEFANAVRTQETGVIGEPVRTQFGYHLILVEAYAPERAQTFDEAKAAVQRQLAEKTQMETWNGFIDSLKAKIRFEESEDDADKDADKNEAPSSANAPEPAGAAK